jgi:hypothetical protein
MIAMYCRPPHFTKGVHNSEQPNDTQKAFIRLIQYIYFFVKAKLIFTTY